MHPSKRVLSFVSLAVGLACLGACGGTDGSGVGMTGSGSGAAFGGAYVCLKAGERSCPNGKVQDARDAELCGKCLAEGQANADCEGPSTCRPDGKDAINIRPECTNQFNALFDCYLKAQVGDAGTVARQ